MIGRLLDWLRGRRPAPPREPQVLHLERGVGRTYCGQPARSVLLTIEPEQATCRVCRVRGRLVLVRRQTNER